MFVVQFCTDFICYFIHSKPRFSPILKYVKSMMINAEVVCGIVVVVTAFDSESGRPCSNPEWGLLYFEASITAQGLPEPSSLRGSTLGTRAAEHKGCNWGMQID